MPGFSHNNARNFRPPVFLHFRAAAHKFLHEHNFADQTILVRLMKEPKIRHHLDKRMKALASVFPELKKWADRKVQGCLIRH